MKILLAEQHTLATSPLFEPLACSLQLFTPLSELSSLTSLNNTLVIDGIRFVPQADKASVFEEHYEPRIFLRGEVQTREHCWHDFFNALVWHRFPRTKKIINQLHYELKKDRFPSKTRLPHEDMLTIFDEHGIIALSKNGALLDLIRNRQWHELFVERREEITSDLSFMIFGHGLYEKALKPYVGLCAHSLLIEADPGDVDELCASIFASNSVTRTRDLIPIPILGYPSWWPKQNDQFYANQRYFRR